MPFGSNTITRRLIPDDNGRVVRGVPGKVKWRRVNVPAVDPPVWWSEYLLEEWKRKNNVDQKRRDSRTAWQRERDEWDLRERNYNYQDGRPRSTGMPTHKVWE